MNRIVPTFASARICLVTPLALVTFVTAWGQAGDGRPEWWRGPAFDAPLERLTVTGADLRDVLRLLAHRHGVNMAVDETLARSVTLHLEQVSVGEALETLASGWGLDIALEGGLLRVSAASLPAPDYGIRVRAGRFSCRFAGADIHRAMTALGDSAGVTILPDRDLAGVISGVVHGEPLREGLAALLSANGLALEVEGAVFRVRSGDPPPGMPPGGGMRILRDGDGIRLDLREAPLAAVLARFAERLSLPLVVLDPPQGTVTLSAAALSVDDALRLLLMPVGWSYQRREGAFLVGAARHPALSASTLIRLGHIKADAAAPLLPESLLERLRVTVVREHNGLLLTGPADALARGRAILKELDRPIPQIFFEVLVVDYNSEALRDIGFRAGRLGTAADSGSGGESWSPSVDILWRAPAVEEALSAVRRRLPGVGVGTLPADFFVRLQALERTGKARIRSRPQLATLNGHPAELKIGETRYYKLTSETPLRDPSQVYLQTTERFQTVDINISLAVTPWVSASGDITVDIHPEFNTPLDQGQRPDLPPDIRSRSLNATVRLRDGETIVLGGLVQEVEEAAVTRFPLLGRVPVLGRFFQRRYTRRVNSELVIYLTPHLSHRVPESAP